MWRIREKIFTVLFRVYKNHYKLKQFKTQLLKPLSTTSKYSRLALLTAISCTPIDNEGKVSENDKLTHEFLIKQSTIQVVDSLTTLLDKITCALLDTYEEYSTILEELLFLHNERLLVLGKTFLEDQVWDKIIETKSLLEDVKKKSLVDLELQITSVSNLANATAEVAFGAGAEYAAIATNERLLSALKQIKWVKNKLDKLEMELIETEAKLVESTVKQSSSEESIENVIPNE